MITPTKAAQAVTDIDILRSALEAEYKDLSELGRGGMAIVYKARERALDREVAIKVLPFTLAFDQSFVERFMREARTAASLEHPHIIPIHRVGQSAQVTYFVMKLLRGQSLSDRLLEKGPLSPQETRRVLAETASALGYAHQHGVVHRDIKPDNILLDESGRCVVTDFGIARSGSQSKLTATGTSVGTPRYMSPEQARAKDVDGRSDIYSLGIVGYECLTGRPPFDGEEMMAILMAHISQPLPRPELASPEAASVYAIIERMLAKTPEERFQSAEEVVAALTGGLDESTIRVNVQTQQPALKHVRSVLSAGKRVVAAQSPKLRAAAEHLGRRLAPIRSYAAANPRQFWGIAAGVLTLGIGVPMGGRLVADNRSRCPTSSQIAATTKSTQASAKTASAPEARPFTLLVDEIGTTRGETEIHYDVCGLSKGTVYTTRITVTKNESGLKRLLGASVQPVTAKFDDKARGPAMRRHRTLDMSGMPVGSYWVGVTVTDDKGRRREIGTTLHVRSASDGSPTY